MADHLYGSFLDNTVSYNVLDMVAEGDGGPLEDPVYHTLCPVEQMDYRDPNLGSLLRQESFADTINTFNILPVQDWRETETLDWARSVCSKRNIPLYGGVNITAFKTIRGRDLLRFSEQDFTRVVGPVYGSLFFRDFQVLRLKELSSNPERKDHNLSLNLESSGVSPYTDDFWLPGEDLKNLEDAIPLEDLIYSKNLPEGAVLGEDVCRGGLREEGFTGSEASSLFDAEEQSYLSDHDQWFSSLVSEELDGMYNSPRLDNEWSGSYVFDQEQWSTSTQAVDQSEESTASYSSSSDRRGEPSSRNTHEESSEDFVFETIPTNARRNRARGLKSWEFLLRLLNNPKYNPRFIEWVDRDLGIFRLVNKDEIARLWGTRRYNGREQQSNLTYEHFSRALRYYYKSKTLIPVTEKHLQYRFGPKVMKNLEKHMSLGK
ncbi:uncharacterized protein LOC143020607 [Oratosquilla oratoria]|uniref:uncharacterized protein LOC143020607 n=1 Tax=Oratosquilla oratoria TaxID=337810 RepID=UPI003F75D861